MDIFTKKKKKKSTHETRRADVFLSGDGLKDRRRKNRQVWKGFKCHQSPIEGRNIDVALFLNTFLHNSCPAQLLGYLSFSASLSPVALPSFTFSNPLKLSLPLSVSPIVRPSLTLLVLRRIILSFFLFTLLAFPFPFSLSFPHPHLFHHPPPAPLLPSLALHQQLLFIFIQHLPLPADLAVDVLLNGW